MQQQHTFIGRVTQDPMKEYGKDSGTPYLNLKLIYDVGFGERKKPMRVKATFYSEKSIDRILNAKVKKGSCLSVNGVIEELVTFMSNDPSEGKVEIICMTGHGWDYLPQTSKKDPEEGDDQTSQSGQQAGGVNPQMPGDPPPHDLDDDGELPY